MIPLEGDYFLNYYCTEVQLRINRPDGSLATDLVPYLNAQIHAGKNHTPIIFSNAQQ